ncbi:hypothetical protein ACQFX9_22825 [Aliinostoc sp. HNIBRCY26]
MLPTPNPGRTAQIFPDAIAKRVTNKRLVGVASYREGKHSGRHRGIGKDT